MNDQTPFSPFSPSVPPTPMSEGEVAVKKTRKKRGPNKNPRKVTTVQPHTVTPGYPAGDKITVIPTRKRAVKQPHTSKYTLFEALQVTRGLAEEDCGLFSDLVCRLEVASKPARIRIVAALGKVFA